MIDFDKRRLGELERLVDVHVALMEELSDRVASLEELGIVRATMSHEAAAAEARNIRGGAEGPFDLWEA